jgi:hypothetical protein
MNTASRENRAAKNARRRKGDTSEGFFGPCRHFGSFLSHYPGVNWVIVFRPPGTSGLGRFVQQWWFLHNTQASRSAFYGSMIESQRYQDGPKAVVGAFEVMVYAPGRSRG